MGKPTRKEYPILEYIGYGKRTQGTEISQYLGGKEINRDSLSSDERTGNSPKVVHVLVERSGKSGHRR